MMVVLKVLSLAALSVVRMVQSSVAMKAEWKDYKLVDMSVGV